MSITVVQGQTAPAGDFRKRLGEDLPCFQCGICCSRYRVVVSYPEARKICEGLGLNWYFFLSNYLEPRDGWESYYLRQRDGACIFLKAVENPARRICLIQAWKPSTCREWMPGIFRRECQEGLWQYWGLKVTPDGEIQGTAERIREFEEALRAFRQV
ncbi:MAG: YkgJ family cysteine cluster protein [Dehalococcoidales bacterium]|nr:YkgJ family cysteine cluster protein [Dehalococcoidales bacterium]